MVMSPCIYGHESVHVQTHQHPLWKRMSSQLLQAQDVELHPWPSNPKKYNRIQQNERSNGGIGQGEISQNKLILK